MTEHKFTDEEIVEIVNAYVSKMCSKCDVKDLDVCCSSCYISGISQALDLINRQNEKITIQQKIIDDTAKEIFRYDSFIRDLHKQIETVKAEAVKEFAEGLKTYYRNLDKSAGALIEYTIDQKLKEYSGSE